LSSYTPGGTTRWMSPELFDPELPGNPRTKSSDCYAFGMVIYEVLSGHVPFHQYENLAVPVKVCGGERPTRPEGSEGVWLMGVWALLERCWTPRPNERPAIKDLLECLVEASRIWTPPSPQVVPSPSTADSSTWNPFDITLDPTTDGGEVGLPLSVAIPVTPFPPNWIRVPQRSYDHGRKRWGSERLESIPFSAGGRPGINIGDALRMRFMGLDGRDDPVLQDASGVISCRLLVSLT
jgi:serine/threonine protein kinase